MYFVNLKTKDYFREGAGWLNLSASTLKERKRHDSQLFLGENWEDYHKNTQLVHDVLGTSPKGANMWDLQRTFRGLSGNQCKNW